MRNRLSVAVAASLSAAAVGIAVAALDSSAEVWLLVAIIGTLAGPIVTRAVRGRFDPFEPIFVFGIAYGVMFVLRPLAMAASGDLASRRPTVTYDIRETFAEMLLLAAIGAAAFVFSYMLPATRTVASKLPPLSLEVPVARVWTVGVGMLLVGAASFAMFLWSGGPRALDLFLGGRSLGLTQVLRESSVYFWYGSALFIPAALVFGASGFRRNNPAMLVAAAVALAMALFRSAPVGSRMFLLPLIGGAFVYFYLARGKRPSAAALLIVGAVALVTSAFILQGREATMRGADSAPEVLAAMLAKPERVLEPLVTGEDAAMAEYLAVALPLIPEKIPYMYGGATAGDLVTRPVPRQFWETKPLTPRNLLNSTLWPAEWAVGAVNVEFSVLLFFYLDFGLAGVAAGMALYGFTWRVLYEYYRRFEALTATRVLFAISLPFLVIALRDSPVDTFTRAAFIVIPVAVAYGFAPRATGSESARRSPSTRLAETG